MAEPIQIMPYSMIVGQKQLKLALELAYIAPRIGGVLLSGQRGTGKSTVVRSFSVMLHGKLPVTLPINATEDRVVGDWDIDRMLSAGELVPQPGLLEQAHGGLLYIDEVNLLDDHIVNIILDVTSTGILVNERQYHDKIKKVHFTLVGTMNPAEGGLRPQLLDRFGLMADVVTESEDSVRVAILRAVLDYDTALIQQRDGRAGEGPKKVEQARRRDIAYRKTLVQAKERFEGGALTMPPDIAQRCALAGKRVQAEGHRGDYILALAASAHATLRGSREVTEEHLKEVAPLALQHRRPGVLQSGSGLWTEEDTKRAIAPIS